MMLSLFRTNQAYASLLLFAYALLLQLPVFIWGEVPAAEPSPAYFGNVLIALVGTGWWLAPVLPPVLLAITGIVANNVADRYRVARTVTQFPGLFVVLLWALCPAFHAFSPLQFALVFLVLAIGALGGTYKGQHGEVARFNSGWWLGLASLLHPAYLIFVPGFVVGISIFQTANLRSISQLATGVVLPYFLGATYAYVSGDLDLFYQGQLAGFGLGGAVPTTLYALLGAALLLIPLVIVLFSGGGARVLLSIEGAKNVSFLYWVLFFTLPVAAFTAGPVLADAQVLVVPLGMLLGLWIGRQEERRAEFYHLLLFAAAMTLLVVTLVATQTKVTWPDF